MAGEAPAPRTLVSLLLAGTVLGTAALALFVGFLFTADVRLVRMSLSVLALMSTTFAAYRLLLADALAVDPGALPRPLRGRRPRWQRAHVLLLLVGAAFLVVLAFRGV